MDLHATHPSSLAGPQDGAEAVECISYPAASSGKGSKSKGSGMDWNIQIDESWVVEHAAQISRMLPGGEACILLSPPQLRDPGASPCLPQVYVGLTDGLPFHPLAALKCSNAQAWP
jgi:hypothetical protein